MAHKEDKTTPNIKRNFVNAMIRQEDVKEILKNCWQAVLGIEKVGFNDNFYELGTTSFNLLQVQQAIKRALEINIKIIDFFTHPTIEELANYITGTKREESKIGLDFSNMEEEIAIIGYSGSFADSETVKLLWENILLGRECISHLNKKECVQLGVSEEVVNNKDYISMGGIISDINKFDAGFWGISPKDAELMDPQARLFLEHAWTALEMSGYIRARNNMPIGVFVGGGGNQYLYCNLLSNENIKRSVDPFEIGILGAKEHIATRASYLLNLRGPAVNVYTACSTALVALVEACEQLKSLNCHLAIAGGVNVIVPQNFGYVYKEGMINSPDGHV
jgi:acyl carrier protein